MPPLGKGADGVRSNMVDRESSELLQALQSDVLEAIARGLPLQSVAERLCARVEQLAPTALCSILTVDAHGRMHPLAAPSLPEAFSRALDGLPIGPDAGCCGAAAYRGEPMETRDLAAAPGWNDYRELAAPLDLRACWSSPIKHGDGRVIGTFAFYYRSHRGPDALERQIVDRCVTLCAIAIERDAVESRVHRLAFYDGLTGLPNRPRFADRAAQMLASLPPEQVATLAFIDLDDFKGLNEALGHRAGDRLLKAVAERLTACLGERALLARYGGDTFAVMTSGATDEARALLHTLTVAFAEPFDSQGQTIGVAACLGLAQAPAHVSFVELSRHAEMALDEAKSEGGGAHRMYAPEMAARVHSRRSFKQDIRHALAAGQFTLVYQPIVQLATNELTAVETLLRWHHPQRGWVAPDEFIPVAEEIGLIGPLGDWVLREACTAAAAWPRAIKVGVNLSPLQFRRPGFARDVVGVLERSGLRPGRLDLEITESALLARDVATRIALHDLHDFGVRLSLDDFGTGFSSLVSLRSFPFDQLKIDMSFVRDLDVDADSTAIVRAVIALARDLGIKTVAEGVETESQFKWLLRHGCTQGQGFYFARPMAAAELHALLASPQPADELIVPSSVEPAAAGRGERSA